MSISFKRILESALETPRSIPTKDIAGMLFCRDKSVISDLYAAARVVSKRCSKKLLKRALIEYSNVCSRDCLYCGIRKSSRIVKRYQMTMEELLFASQKAKEEGFAAIAVQGGEIKSNNDFIAEFLSKVDVPEITLSLGEQSVEVYKRWKDAAKGKLLRYLLRIESSNKKLFYSIHSKEASFENRLNCIRSLKSLGYITGSGVMIGLPDQSIEDLANDIVFFGEEMLDMVGMGPYIPCENTSLKPTSFSAEERLELSLKMIALTRLYLWDVNIVASTALEVLSNGAKELAIAAGANVLMPNFTPSKYRLEYQLYPGKEQIS